MSASVSFWHFSPIPIFGSISDANQLPCYGDMVPHSAYFFFGFLKHFLRQVHLVFAFAASILDGALYLQGFLGS